MELIDNDLEEHISNKRVVARLITIAIIGLLSMISTEILRPYLSVNLIESGAQINTIGLVILILSLLLILFITRSLNMYEPQLGELKIAIFTGLNLGIVIGLFKVFVKVGFYDSRLFIFNDFLFHLIIGVIMYSVIGFLLSNILIRKIRGQNTSNSIILLVSIVVLFGISINWLS